MKQETYNRIFTYLESHGTLKQFVMFVNNWVTLITYLAYPLMIVKLLAGADKRVIEFVLIPAVTFAVVSAARKFINARRPYEIYGFIPLVPKDTKGQSCPSRHVFAVFIIAMGFLYIQWPLGVLFFVMGALLAACRVAIGVHFPKDVLIGALTGVVCGFGFYAFDFTFIAEWISALIK